MKFSELFKRKPTEDGRSMTEMLGVLAIIGVLSLGGITAYKYAIDQHQGNEVLNNLNLMAVSFSAQLESDPTIDSFSNEFDLTPFGITVDAYPSDIDGIVAAEGEAADYFTIDLSGMTPDICRHVLRNFDLNAYIEVDGEEFDGDLDVCDNLDVVSLWNGFFVKEAHAADGTVDTSASESGVKLVKIILDAINLTGTRSVGNGGNVEISADPSTNEAVRTTKTETPTTAPAITGTAFDTNQYGSSDLTTTTEMTTTTAMTTTTSMTTTGTMVTGTTTDILGSPTESTVPTTTASLTTSGTPETTTPQTTTPETTTQAVTTTPETTTGNEGTLDYIYTVDNNSSTTTTTTATKYETTTTKLACSTTIPEYAKSASGCIEAYISNGQIIYYFAGYDGTCYQRTCNCENGEWTCDY